MATTAPLIPNISASVRGLVHELAKLAQPLAEMEARQEVIRECARADAARLAGMNVQVITTSEGRCRLSIKRLGGWS